MLVHSVNDFVGFNQRKSKLSMYIMHYLNKLLL